MNRKRNNIRLALLWSIFLTGIYSSVQGQVSLVIGSNPAVVVTMGDSLSFTGTVLSSTAYPTAEILVKLPEGFELLTSSPDFKPGSLSINKREGRILMNIPLSPTPFTVHVKALCNAQSFPLVTRIITYELYGNASDIQPLATTSTTGISNFYDPILNVGYPASMIVPLNTSLTREFTLTQTAASSHINNLQVVATCDTSGFYQ
jgi:hypothetical protein